MFTKRHDTNLPGFAKKLPSQKRMIHFSPSLLINRAVDNFDEIHENANK